VFVAELSFFDTLSFFSPPSAEDWSGGRSQISHGSSAKTPPTKNTQHSNSKDKISFFIFILQKVKNLNSDHYFVPNSAKNPPPTREINAITKITMVMILKVLLLFIFLI
jgi:hypothetical protein